MIAITKTSHTRFIPVMEYFAEMPILFIILFFSLSIKGIDTPKIIIICIESRLATEKFIPIRSSRIMAIVSTAMPTGKESPTFSVNENFTETMLTIKKPQQKARNKPKYSTIIVLYSLIVNSFYLLQISCCAYLPALTGKMPNGSCLFTL